jgi:phospholipase C
MGPTDPNRLYALSGTIDPAGKAGGPTVSNFTRPGVVSWETMPERLEARGISWKVYNPPGSQYQPTNGASVFVSDNVLLGFEQYQDPSSTLYKKAFYNGSFARDVAAGTLPQVSWIIPPSTPKDYDEHPPAPPVYGGWFLHQLISTLVSNPSVWARTVLFIVWDENDGFFDHVPPPTPPPGTDGEYLTASPLPSDANGVAGPIGLGFRVPMLVVSPFSRGGYVCSDTFEHTSQLRFLETRFGVEVPNLSAWRRSVSGDLTSTLDLKSFDSSVPRLPAPSLDDPRVARECKPLQLAAANVPVPPYPVPAVQQLPAQEPGRARRRG